MDIELPVNYDLCTPAQRRIVREQYIAEQGGRCYHCGNPLNAGPASPIVSTQVAKGLFPRGFFANPVHLHHNHKTGMTIGAVHARCNAVLWQYYGE